MPRAAAPKISPAKVPARVYLYCRVSSRGQASDGTSLDGQTEQGQKHCAALGWPDPIVLTETESGSAEKQERRVVLRDLLRDARPGDVVLVASLDRFSRDILFGVKEIRALVARGVGWYAIREGLDASTPEGDSNLGLRMWLAEEERKRIRDRTVGRSEELRRQGLWTQSTVPWGYRRGNRAERRHLHLAADPDAAPHVREVFERIVRGESLRTVVEWAGTVDGPKLTSGLYKIVKGRIYLGEMHVGGEWLRGQHPALVDEELWRRAQEAMRGRRSAGPSPWGEVSTGLLLAGVLRCAVCGHTCGIAQAHKRFRYYVCNKRTHTLDNPGGCSGPYVRVEKIDPVAEEAVLGRLRELRETLTSRPVPRGETRAKPTDYQALRQRIEARRARAVSAYTDGTITGSELAAQRVRLDVETEALRRREETAGRDVRAADPVARGGLKRALADVKRSWSGLDIADRRKVVRLLAARVELREDGRLSWTWRQVPDLVDGRAVATTAE
jgi:DNA invertase Pin-like site-specific DNA recombinase